MASLSLALADCVEISVRSGTQGGTASSEVQVPECGVGVAGAGSGPAEVEKYIEEHRDGLVREVLQGSLVIGWGGGGCGGAGGAGGGVCSHLAANVRTFHFNGYGAPVDTVGLGLGSTSLSEAFTLGAMGYEL
jgi:hypothetical protein